MLYLETKYTTLELQAAGGLHGTMLCLRQMPQENSPKEDLCIKEIASEDKGILQLLKTVIYQKDTKTLKKMHYLPEEVKDKFVWPNPEYNLPAIYADVSLPTFNMPSISDDGVYYSFFEH